MNSSTLYTHPARTASRRQSPLLCAVSTLLMAVAVRGQCAVVTDVVPGPQGSFPQGFAVAFGRDLYFTCASPTWGSEVWKWSADGGITLVRDINPGTAHATPQDLTACCTAVGPRVFFAAFSPGAGSELWMTDGSTAGTVMVRDIHPGNSSSFPRAIFAADGRVYFTADDGVNGGELWTSDGTAAGTVMVADINPGPPNSLPGTFANAGGRTVFTAFTAANGRELYVTDGSTAGTQLLLDIDPGPGSGGPVELAPHGAVVFFSATTTTWGMELWKSDGTAAGTVMVKDIAPNSSSSSPIHFCSCGDAMFFNAVVGATGRELYRSDGTAAGTVMVKDINPGAGSSGPNFLTCSGNRVFFSATVSTATTGTELWVSDGTAAGTYELDIFPGTSSSFPQLFVPCGAGVCLRATDGNGAEPWFSDGTMAGTFRVCDLLPGSASGNPTQFGACNGRVFFTAPDPNFGQELFQIATPGAMVAALGHAGRPDRPSLGTRAGATPILGTTVDLVGAGPAAHIGVLFIGRAGYPTPAIPGLMDGGCDWVGALSGMAILLAVTGPPALSAPLPIPNDPGLEGVALHFQAAWVAISGALPLQFSNGLQLVPGTAAAH